jgi:hypothetical protein
LRLPLGISTTTSTVSSTAKSLPPLRGLP